MIFCLLPIAVVGAVALYLMRWRSGVRRRNIHSWDSLLARLTQEWSARELSEHFLWKEGLTATPDEAWQRMRGPKGLWVMYQNAGVMIEMADYAARNSESVDRLLIETSHSDAMQIRVCVLTALVQYAILKADDGVRIKAFRAASMYACMSSRMTQLLQTNASMILPHFVAAM